MWQNSPGKYEVGDGQTVPRRMLEEPILTSAVVDEDHQRDADPGPQQTTMSGEKPVAQNTIV